MDTRLNKMLDVIIDEAIPRIYRVTLVAFCGLAIAGIIMALADFDPTASIFTQATLFVWWPITLAPLWWKLSILITGAVVLLPRILFTRDP